MSVSLIYVLAPAGSLMHEVTDRDPLKQKKTVLSSNARRKNCSAWPCHPYNSAK